MRLAVLVKPGLAKLDDDLITMLSQAQAVFIADTFGGSLLASRLENTVAMECSTYEKGYVNALKDSILGALDYRVDAIVCVGGDGLSTYVVTILTEICPDRAKRPPVLGWGAGTANVGPIVRANHSKDLSSYKPVNIDALEVRYDDVLIGYAFNDLIIGNTLLGTKDGQWRNLDAFSMAYNGTQIVTNPSEHILGPDFCMRLNGEVVPPPAWAKTEEGPWCGVKQICFSTLVHGDYSSRAVSGGLIQSVGYDHPAAVALMDRIAVDSRPETWNYKGIVNTAHLCFDCVDTIEMEGFTQDGQIIIDGNPFIRHGGVLSVKSVPDIITAMRCTPLGAYNE